MRANFDKRWLLPSFVVTASVLVTLVVIIVDPSPADRSPADCSGALSTDYACHQDRYQSLVRDSGVDAAFAELEDEYKKNEFAKLNCHQLVHVIGRAAAERYGDVSRTYAQGDDFCSAGYYHGAMEAFVAEIGAEKVLEEADTLCVDLRGNLDRSFDLHNCAHGLGHGFMNILKNELFEALQTCDALADGWERDRCYGGVFMQNLMSKDDPSHPTEYLEADRPLYPCTAVEERYKRECYNLQIQYAIKTQGEDFAKGFDLCATAVEDDFRSVCYQGLGNYAAGQSIAQGITQAGQTKSAKLACMLGEVNEARPNCIAGAAKGFILHYEGDEQARAFCESVEADLRALCLRAAEESMVSKSA